MRILVWLVRAALFLMLLAFALNNQHEASIKWFFGREWRTPMIFVVLGALALGCAFGVLAMLPSWWAHRRAAQARPASGKATESTQPAALDSSVIPTDSKLLQHEL